MRVALVYNQKKEDSSEQLLTDDETEPPSLRGEVPPATDQEPNSQSPHQNFSDLYAEWDTFETIDAVRNALSEVHSVSLVEADEHIFRKLTEERPEIVFNIAEGMNGVSREAQVPALLEMLGIPYTGSDPLTLAVCLDKSRAKEILSYHGIPTPAFSVVSSLSELSGTSPYYPCIVKPLHEGSSKGIFDSSVVKDAAGLRGRIRRVLEKYDEPVLIEEYLPGREFTVGLLGNGNDLIVLPIVEIIFDTLPRGVNPIYSYEAKWIWDQSDSPLDIFRCPARIPDDLKNEIEKLCRRSYTILRCRDWCRIDVRLDKNSKPYILELNPLPGILPRPEDNSCLPKAAKAAGISYNRLIQSVLAFAADRYGREFQSQFNSDKKGIAV